MLDIVHFLHLLSGTAWAGGAIFFAFVVEPTLLRLDPAAMRGFTLTAGRFAGPLMAGSGILLLLTGVARAWLGGGIATPADIITPYGLYSLAALAIVVFVTVTGGRHRASVAALLAAEGDRRAEIAASWRSHATITGVGLIAVVAIMAILGLGLY